MRPRRPAAPAPPDPEALAEVDRPALDPGDLDGERDRVLADVSLANLRTLRGRLTRVRFERCRMTGFQWPEGELQDVRFVGCSLELANLRGADLRRVRFEDCVLREADLTGARLTDVLITGCDLRGADLAGVRSQRLELRSCRVEGLQGVDGLRGALVLWSDVLDLAAPLAAAAGLVVLSDEDDG